MSFTRNSIKLSDKNVTDLRAKVNNDGETRRTFDTTDNYTYAVTVSTKPSSEVALCSNQKSFISIHSTDNLCQVDNRRNTTDLDDCNVEILSLNNVFPSTSEESSNDEDISTKKSQKNANKTLPNRSENAGKIYVPTNSKSATGARQKEIKGESHASVFSEFDIPKSTLHVVGSNPGEPKMTYQDPPKKISKTMKKFLRNIDKHKIEQSFKNDNTLSKLNAIRGILKDGRCDPDSIGDSAHGVDQYFPEDSPAFPMEFSQYTKLGLDKSVSFNTQVVIIHFSGDLCLGQSVEALSKERDQQARNSELRKTFLTKYNEFWPTQK